MYTFFNIVAVALLLNVSCFAEQDVGADALGEHSRSVLASSLIDICDFVQSQGDSGTMIYICVLALAIVCCLPCTVFEIIPGFLFGPLKGAIVCAVGKNLGNLLCIILAKTILADYARKHVLPRLKHARVLERMVQKQGFTAVCIFRGVVYAPLPLKNYGLGALDIPGYCCMSRSCSYPLTKVKDSRDNVDVCVSIPRCARICTV